MERERKISLNIQPFAESDRDDIMRLQSEAKLPTEDGKMETLINFLVAREENGTTIGVVGVELYQDPGLLRSLVVHPSCSGRELGKQLTNEVEAYARGKGVKALFLLTMAAANFFPRLGYQVTQRFNVPQLIAETLEFKSACHASAVCLHKNLG